MLDYGWRLAMGAEAYPGGVRFRVWAPAARKVEVEVYGEWGVTPYPLTAADGLHEGFVEDIGAGARYKYRLNEGASFPDPYSRSQPEGVHAPSEVVNPSAFEWHDQEWHGLGPQGLILYEVHVGTFTPEGTFDALRAQLPVLKDLGVNALQILPVAAFPGGRNWGYDGVDLYAPAAQYGGPDGLRRLVDAAHALGLAVLLDVVYNHLGPAGNYLRAYSPRYFTSAYRTPWGEALNFDQQGSWGTREYVAENACYWLNEYHIDGLRLDATHAIFDRGPRHILREITRRARRSLPPERKAVLIAEDANNDVRFLQPASEGGHGFDMVYADDFHHEVRVLLTGEREGYYLDYDGKAERIARVIREGFLYQGEFSTYQGGSRGTKTSSEPAYQFLFSLQNHDQVGNRAFGERLHHVIDTRRYAAISALLLLAPETPALFMGQEFAASSPFLFFTDHEPDLGRLVTEGRRREFARFRAFSDPVTRERIPDPQAEETFLRSKLDLSERERHAGIYRLFRDLIALRRSDPVFARQDRHALRARAIGEGALALHYQADGEHRLLLVNLGGPLKVAFETNEFLGALPAEARYPRWASADPAYDTAESPLPRDRRLETSWTLPEGCAVVLGPAVA